MSLQRQVVFWGAAFLALILILYLLGPILLPFVAGMALAYALDPLADRLERLGLGRMAATIVILLLFALVFAMVVIAIVPVLVQQIGQFAQNVPEYSSRLRDLVQDAGAGILQSVWLNELLGLSGENGGAGGAFNELASQAAGWLGQVLQSVVSGGLAVANLIALLVVTPVVAFYLLYDWDRMVDRVDAWVPRDHVETVRMLARQIDDALAGFVRGQGLLCIFLSVFYAAGLTLIGLNFGLLIGIGAGLISFIPYVGSILGFFVGVSVALVQFWPDWIWVVAVAAVFMAGNFIEGNLLQPKLLGDRVGLHPVWLIFAIFAFGYLFGFVGILLAVPLAAAIGVLARFAIRQYLESAYYRGSGGHGPGPR